MPCTKGGHPLPLRLRQSRQERAGVS
jgi:hypothetical protein